MIVISGSAVLVRRRDRGIVGVLSNAGAAQRDTTR